MRIVAALSLALSLLGGCASESIDDSAFSTQTNLYWQRCAVGSSWDGLTCSGEAEELDWDGAVDACGALGPGYRLPSLDELALLLGACTDGDGAAQCAPCAASGECSSVLADPDFFGWTWTGDRTASAGAFVVDLRDGVIAFDEAERGFYARCVTETP